MVVEVMVAVVVEVGGLEEETEEEEDFGLGFLLRQQLLLMKLNLKNLILMVCLSI